MKPKFIFRLVVALMLLFVANVSSAQTKSETLLARTWKLDHYEQGGKTLPPPAGHESDRMIFKADKSVVSRTKGQDEAGTWSYDEASKQLKVVITEDKMELKLRVIEITESSFVGELGEGARAVKMFMKPE